MNQAPEVTKARADRNNQREGCAAILLVAITCLILLAAPVAMCMSMRDTARETAGIRQELAGIREELKVLNDLGPVKVTVDQRWRGLPTFEDARR